MERGSQFSGFLNSLPKVISILYIFYCRKDRMPSGSFQHGLLGGLLFFYQSQIQNERQTRLAFYLFDLKKLPLIILIIFVLHDLNSIENNEICVMKKDSDNNHLATLKNRQNCLPTYFSIVPISEILCGCRLFWLSPQYGCLGLPKDFATCP